MTYLVGTAIGTGFLLYDLLKFLAAEWHRAECLCNGVIHIGLGKLTLV